MKKPGETEAMLKNKIVFTIIVILFALVACSKKNLVLNPATNETGGLCYLHLGFPENFVKLELEITIHTEPSNKDGLFWQFYQGEINGIPFYFGLQTDVFKPGQGWAGKGIIFSRWKTQDLKNTKTPTDGWVEVSTKEGEFIGVRKNYNWRAGYSYKTKLALAGSDKEGDWYGVFINDEWMGSLRFPFGSTSFFNFTRGISWRGSIWMEIFFKATPDTPIPRWHTSLSKKIVATTVDGKKIKPRSGMAENSKINGTEIKDYGNSLHFIMDPKLIRQHSSRWKFIDF